MARFKAMRPFANVPKLAFSVSGQVPKQINLGDEFEIAPSNTDLSTFSPSDAEKANIVLRHNMAILMDDERNKPRLATLQAKIDTLAANAKRKADAEAKRLAGPSAQLTALIEALIKKASAEPKGA
jgi:hypothetical protein